jgi:hypothetical protein
MNTQTSSEQVRAWLAQLPTQHEPVVAALGTLLDAVAPDAHEVFCHGAPGYGPSESCMDRIFYIAAFSSYVNLGFFYGGSLHDPEGLLVGSGKRMRHIKLRSPQECANPALRRLVEQAWVDGVQRVAERRGQ